MRIHFAKHPVIVLIYNAGFKVSHPIIELIYNMGLKLWGLLFFPLSGHFFLVDLFLIKINFGRFVTKFLGGSIIPIS